MEESEENLSSEDINNTNSPSVINKPKKRSLVERELETSLTARVISPISAGDGVSTSRYGRARRLKNENSESDKVVKMLKSPKTEISPKSTIKSPVYKMHASNSPIKLDSQKPEPFESQIENIYSENNSLSRFGSAEKKISPSKRQPKVYIRKDLIQLKDKDKAAEETVVLIKNMFSPVSAQKTNRSSLERSMEKTGKRKLSSKNTQSVVKTLDFDEKQIINDDKSKKDGKSVLLKSEIFELEAKSVYQVGDLAWARMGTYPFWPCIVTREPGSGLFVKTKLFGRTVRKIFNVTFFGDNGRRSWIVDSMLRQFLGQLEFETTRTHFTSEAKKKDPKLYSAFFISEKKMPQWLLSVEEAETLLREPKRLRIDILSSMLVKVRPEKVTAKIEKGKKVTRTDSDVSLSESLYDTLFSEDDSKGNDSDRRNKRKQSLDVSDVVTACLDNMAAKTGMTKIQRQSHMDRWLLKAKTKTPEKSQAVQKAATINAKTHKPTNNVSQKSYRFRNRHNESQSSDNSVLNDNCEASSSSHYKSISVANDVIKEISNDRLHSESILENDSSIFKSPVSETVKTVSNEHTTNVLNKIKQSIDSDENMASTSSADVSGMSTFFEISRVDTQLSDKEIVESDANENFSEVTDDKINENILCYEIDRSGPITSSPKNIKVIEVSAEDSSSDHANEDGKSEVVITEGDETKRNECANKEEDGKSDKNVYNINGVHEEVTENNSNFRKDKKIKTRQKGVNTVDHELTDEKSNVCELNTPNTRSKKLHDSDGSIDLGSDKLKLNKTESIYDGIHQKIAPETAISQTTHDELKQHADSSNTIEGAHKSIVENKEKELLLENKLKKEEARNEDIPQVKVNSEAINMNGPLNIPETILNNNYSTISSKCAMNEKKCDEIVSIDNSPAQNHPPNDVKMYNNPVFQKYLELKQDSVMDEHPELSQDEITSYLYKTWQYETKDIFENKVTSTANKTPAKGTNYKALDKERGPRKLARKKTADITQDKTIVSSINKSPVNGYHKEIKPIIISPKNKIIFLPRNNIDSVKNNVNFNDFKISSTLITKVQTPGIEHKGISGGSDDISVAQSIADMKKVESELPSVSKLEEANVLSKDNNAQQLKIDNSNRNDINTPDNNKKLTQNRIESLSSFPGSNPDELFVNMPRSNKMQKFENVSGTKAAYNNKKISPTKNIMFITQNGFEDVTNRIDIKNQLTHDYDGDAIECKVTNSIKSISETAQTRNVCLIPQQDVQMSSTVLKTETLAISKKKKPSTVNNIEHTMTSEQKIRATEKNKLNVTEVLTNGSFTETRELEVKNSSSKVLQNCVTGSNFKERENEVHMNVLNSRLQNKHVTSETDDDVDCHNKDQIYESASEVKCLGKPTIIPAEQNVKSLNTSIHEKKIKVTQTNDDVKCKENTEYANKNSKSSVQEITKYISSDGNDIVHSNLRNSKCNSKIFQNNSEIPDMISNDQNRQICSDIKSSECDSTINALESTMFNKDKKQQNITLDKTIISTPNKNKVFTKNYETKLATQEDFISSKQHKENIVLNNPEFQKYVELKQDSVTDEHPELSRDEVIQYLYKTWLYEVENKFEKKDVDDIDQTSLVQGVATINANNDKKRKKLSIKRPSYSTDKKKPTLSINHFFKRAGFQGQFENSLNPKSEIQAIESDSILKSQYESSSSSKVTVSDRKSHDPDVKNNDQKLKNFNESTVYEPKEVNDEQSKLDDSPAIKSELPSITRKQRDNFGQSSSSTDGQSEIPLSTRKRRSIVDQSPLSSSTASESEIPLSIRKQRDSFDQYSSSTDGKSEIPVSTRKQRSTIDQSPSRSSTTSESEIPISIRKQHRTFDQSSSSTDGKSEIPLSTKKQRSTIDQSPSSSSTASESEIPISIRKQRGSFDQSSSSTGNEMSPSTEEQSDNFDRCASCSSSDSKSESPLNIRKKRDNFDQWASSSSSATESEIRHIIRKQRDNQSPSSSSTVSVSEKPLSARKKRDTIDPFSSSTASESEMAVSVKKQSDDFDRFANSNSTDSMSESPLNVRKKRDYFDQWASSSSTASESEIPLSARKQRDNIDKCAPINSNESKSDITFSTKNQDDHIDRGASSSTIASESELPLIARKQSDNTDKSACSSSTANDSVIPLSAKKHDNFDQSISSTDSETEMPLSTRKQRLKQKSAKRESNRENKNLMEPEFVRYLELRQDSVMDEHPELSHEEVIQYLYKTWHYEEDNKSEKKITDEVDQTSLVKGISSIYSDKDKKRKKLSRKRPSDFSDRNKKPTTLVNKFLMQNSYREYHEKSLDASDPVVFPSITKADQQNVNDIEIDTDNDVISYDEELKSHKDAPSSLTDSESEIPSEKKLDLKEKRTQADKKKEMMDAEFVRYLELRQDYVMDEHPELTEEEITNYLYKTWLYEEKIKNDKKIDDEIDQTTLVKGVDVEQKKPKRKYKMIKEDSQESFKVSEVFDVEPKEKSKRSAARPYYNEEISDIEEELALFEIFRKKKPKSNVEQQAQPSSSQPIQDDLTLDTEEISNIEDYVYNEMDMVEMYFEQLTTPKPNVFKGLVRERVCEICEKVSNLVKCKTCHGMFHADCVKNQNKTQAEDKIPSRGRKKKKKYRRRIKNPDDTLDEDIHSDEKTQDGSDPNLSFEAEREPIVVNAEDFEAIASAKMREILGDLDKVKYEYESTSVAISWNARPGKCQVVDVKLEIRPPEELIDASNFKCNACEKCDIPKCFVCKAPVSPKERVEYRQKCQVAHCYKYYHLECLAHWPQTQFNGGDVRNKSKEGFEAMSCPRHVCHTCVSDDPRGCKTRFSGDKLARCVRCPATYHSFTKCLPAGSQILTGSQIICPRHYEHRPGKVPCHVNTGWCFICALGGTLICCEYCPTSFHAECLNIDPPEGGYMCEDCETGRLPLYGEMVWVKLGHYRWWPGIILHPSQIPGNIVAVKHTQGEFVVRFFGQYDHYWVNRGRVFPFQEGDTGKISSQKSKIDSAFTLAVEHASRACEILKNAMPNDEESQDIASSLLPPHYVKLKVNKPVGSLINRRIDVEESSLTQCECDPCDAEPCGPYSQCLNRVLLTECGPTCRAGERCNNRAFEKRQYPKMAPYRTPHRGWGLRCSEAIKAGQFVIEYVGELLDEAEFQRRMRRKHEVRDENFYFLTLDKERMIDAGPKGNLARFMNHSCEPNCETQKWTVLGDVRVGLFAINDIPANSELTFNYNLESAGIEKKQCMCGAKRCSGYIGAKPKQSDPQPKKNKIVKKMQKKTKKTDPQQKRPRGRPCKPKELTEIEKDLLIIKNATSASENDIMANKNSSVSSESEFSELCSLDSKDSKGVKRKRSSPESLTLCLKRVKTGEADEFRID